MKKTPDKVTIEITRKGFVTTIWQGEEKLSEREDIADETGSHATKEGDFCDDFDEDDDECQELADKVSGSFYSFDIMNALQEVYVMSDFD
jgi:hypothetical protein